MKTHKILHSNANPIFLCAAVMVGLCAAGPARAANVSIFSEDFEDGSAAPQFSGAGSVADTQGYSDEGDEDGSFGENFLRNTTNPPQATVLTLTGLPDHDSIDLNFFLAIIDSWDGSAGVASPDFFNVEVDDVRIFQESFEYLASSSADQSYTPPSDVVITERTQEGFSSDVNWVDSAYNLGDDPAFDGIAHTASTLTIEWFAGGNGWQGGIDESWAIDNVEVILNGVDTTPTPIPVPGAVWLGLAGLGMLGGACAGRKCLRDKE